MKIEFSGQIFEKIRQFHIPWKSAQSESNCPMRTEGGTEGRTDRQTDMTKLIVAFRNFAKAPENKRKEEIPSQT